MNSQDYFPSVPPHLGVQFPTPASTKLVTLQQGSIGVLTPVHCLLHSPGRSRALGPCWDVGAALLLPASHSALLQARRCPYALSPVGGHW